MCAAQIPISAHSQFGGAGIRKVIAVDIIGADHPDLVQLGRSLVDPDVWSGRTRLYRWHEQGVVGMLRIVNRERLNQKELVRLRRARDLMDRWYAVPLDVPTMAHAAFMSPSHFTRRFRLAYGETPTPI